MSFNFSNLINLAHNNTNDDGSPSSSTKQRKWNRPNWQPFNRPSLPVPSVHHQTILSKALYEHCLDELPIAVVAASSSSLRNSSLAPNLCGLIPMNMQSMELLLGVIFSPSSSSCSTVQFTNSLDITPVTPEFLDQLGLSILSKLKNETKYFTKSLRKLSLTYPKLSVLKLFFLNDGKNNKSSNVWTSLESFNITGYGLFPKENEEQDGEPYYNFFTSTTLPALSSSVSSASSPSASLEQKSFSIAFNDDDDFTIKHFYHHLTFGITTNILTSLCISGSTSRGANKKLSINDQEEASFPFDLMTSKASWVSSLKTLRIAGGGGHDDEEGLTDENCLVFLPRFENLTKLDLSWNQTNFSGAGLANILSQFWSLNRLEVLILTGVETVCEGVFEKIYEYWNNNNNNACTSLTEIDFTNCVALTDRCLYVVAKTCPNLAKLKLHLNSNITFDETSNGGKQNSSSLFFPNLEDLHISRCDGLTPSGFKNIGLCCANGKMKDLQLFQCTELTEHHLRNLIFVSSSSDDNEKRFFPSLNSISLTGSLSTVNANNNNPRNPIETEKMIQQLITICPSLTELRFNGLADCVTDDSLPFFASDEYLPHLERIFLFNTNVTTNGVEELFIKKKIEAQQKFGKSLFFEYVDIRGCKKIPPSEYNELVKKYPSMVY